MANGTQAKRTKRKPQPKKPKGKLGCRNVRDPKTRKWKKKCTRPAPKAGKPAAAPITTPPAAPAPSAPAPESRLVTPAKNQPLPPSAAAPPATAILDALPAPPPLPSGPAPDLAAHTGPFGVREATRLLWRAGFGPRPGEAEHYAALGLDAAVQQLIEPPAQTFTGPEPRDGTMPLAPADVWGHDHVWWLDRMVRSDQPLIERMTLVWHDWFATSLSGVGRQDLMLGQNDVLRRHALGSFRDLLLDVTVDPAMLVWLDGIANSRRSPNENYARELMELFTLGADRGAYSEADIRELARALTGWRATWNGEKLVDFRFDPTRHDTGMKTLWSGTPYESSAAQYGWRGACHLTLQHPMHRSFFVAKLWSYFIPTPPDAQTAAALEYRYVTSGYSIAAVLQGILKHPDFHMGAAMVKPPIVLTAGLLRATGGAITTAGWAWRSTDTGQRLFMPPNVAGWNDQAWLDTSTYKGRWNAVYGVLANGYLTSATAPAAGETPDQAVDSALAFWGNPVISVETRQALQSMADQPAPTDANAATWRALRQNALRHLIAMSPDYQVC